MPSVAERLGQVRRRIERAGGSRSMTIVAVTKGFGNEAVRAALDAGLTDFGENYAQSLLAKAQDAAGEPSSVIKWHFVGAIQRRKVAKLAPHVHLWQSVARRAEGQEIARRTPGAAVLVQVDVTGEPQRNGCPWQTVPELVEHLRGQGLHVRGLMCVGPRERPRPQFRRMASLAAELRLPELSMGMSEDFEVAVAEGATMLRLGKALFGPRPEALNLRR